MEMTTTPARKAWAIRRTHPIFGEAIDGPFDRLNDALDAATTFRTTYADLPTPWTLELVPVLAHGTCPCGRCKPTLTIAAA